MKENKNYISIIYNFDYETTNNKYEQEQASYLYGSLRSGLSEVNDHYKFRSLKNIIELKTKSSFFDELTLGYINYNYNFSKAHVFCHIHLILNHLRYESLLI